MATHSSILAWRIPWTEEPDRPWSIRSQRVGPTKVTKQRIWIKNLKKEYMCISESPYCLPETNKTLYFHSQRYMLMYQVERELETILESAESYVRVDASAGKKALWTRN